MQKRIARLENYLNKTSSDDEENYKKWKIFYIIASIIFYVAITYLGLLFLGGILFKSLTNGLVKEIPIDPTISIVALFSGFMTLVCFIVYKNKESKSYESGDDTKPKNRVTERFKKIKPI